MKDLANQKMNELASINTFESSAFELLLFFLVVALVFASLLQRVSQKMSNDNFSSILLCISSLVIYLKV